MRGTPEAPWSSVNARSLPDCRSGGWRVKNFGMSHPTDVLSV